ncbi:hypothetical protein ACQKGI_10090 [Peribacillus muralis]
MKTRQSRKRIFKDLMGEILGSMIVEWAIKFLAFIPRMFVRLIKGSF